MKPRSATSRLKSTRDGRRQPKMKLDASVRALVQGVVAAPPSFDPNGWMALAGDNPSPEMMTALHAMKAEVEKSFDDGLDVSPAPQLLTATYCQTSWTFW